MYSITFKRQIFVSLSSSITPVYMYASMQTCCYIWQLTAHYFYIFIMNTVVITGYLKLITVEDVCFTSSALQHKVDSRISQSMSTGKIQMTAIKQNCMSLYISMTGYQCIANIYIDSISQLHKHIFNTTIVQAQYVRDY